MGSETVSGLYVCVSLCVCSEYQCVVYSLNADGHLQIVCMWVWVCTVSISTCSEDVCHCGNVWNKYVVRGLNWTKGLSS